MTLSSSDAPTVLGGRYRVEGPLGRGGMAEVRAGTDLRLQRPVAIKVLLPEMAARPDIRRRFEAEARAAASFNNPHAVAVFDTGEHDGQPYIVMERLPGDTMASRIAAGPSDPEWLRQVAGEVLGALGAAHAVGLVHRDVKPGNILLTADGHAKIADFGIAKSLDEAAATRDLTGTGQLLGTPAYLPPERIDGGPATARSDLYSFGVVLYEALTGRCPFRGDTPLAAARAVIAGDYPPLAEARPGLDPALVAAVERAMATDPSRRFDSAAAMGAALAPVAARSGAHTVVDGAFSGPGTTVLDRRDLAPAGGAGVPLVDTPTRPRFRVPLAVLVTVAFIALLAAGLDRNGRPPATDPAAAAAGQPATAPASTPEATLAGALRAAAGRLGPADGARAGDLAASLRTVADKVEAGDAGAGATATGAIVSAGAWRLTGQLTDAAAASAVEVLGQVPGATVVTLRSQPAPTVTVPGRAKGKDKDEDED